MNIKTLYLEDEEEEGRDVNRTWSDASRQIHRCLERERENQTAQRLKGGVRKPRNLANSRDMRLGML